MIQSLELVFPELKKTKDELINEELIHFLETCQDTRFVGNRKRDEWIEWLEKQSGKTKSMSEIVSIEQNPEINDDVLSRFSFYQYDDDILYLSNVFVEECNRKRGYGRKILKAAEEVAKTFGISKIRLKVESNTWMEEWYKRNGYVYLISEGKYDWLEKQCEKKQHLELKDGYDTKFKVGDWVVLEDSLSTYKILEVCKSWYEVISYNDGMQYSIGFDKENDCRLWSIEDAEKGDILQANKCTLIFDSLAKDIDGNTVISSWYHCNTKAFYGMGTCKPDLWVIDGVVPATKEQCYFLFSKMKESGYKWDSNKKELIKQ